MKIGKYLKKYWYAYSFAVLSMVTAILLDMLYPVVTKSIVDDVIIGGSMELLTKLLMGIVMIGLGRAIGGYIKEFAFDYASANISMKLRRDLFRHIQGLSVDYFDDTNTGELMARVKDDIDKVWAAVGFVGMLLIEIVIHVSIVIFCMFRLSPQLMVIPFLVMVMIGVLAVVMERRLNAVYGEISVENAQLTTIAEENLAGVRTVKAFTRERFEINKFLSHNKRYYELNMRQSKIMVRYYPFFQLAGKLLPVMMAIIGGVQVIHNEMSLGTLIAFVEYCRNAVWPMEMLGWITNDLSSAFASYHKINQIYANSPSVKEKEKPEILEQIEGNIAFEHVTFIRDGKEIIKDISFQLEPGQALGIMGATGAGKTTIVNLLLRFFDTTSGEVKLENRNIKNLGLGQIRKSISFVMQDVFLFSDTIKENLMLGKRNSLQQKDLEDAAALAQAKGFIEKTPTQYDTVVGERGVGLSGGQKQRLSIARAIAKKNPILILDDSTSALDMETEFMIQKSLEELKSTTKIIIAHRISAVRNADEIIFLENGEIKERGTHQILMEKKGLYYETYLAQYGN